MSSATIMGVGVRSQTPIRQKTYSTIIYIDERMYEYIPRRGESHAACVKILQTHNDARGLVCHATPCETFGQRVPFVTDCF